MDYEELSYRPDLFSKVLVSPTRLARIVAYCRHEAIGRDGLADIEGALRELLDERSIRKATYGMVVHSDQIDADDIRDRVSNVASGRLTCVWGIAVNESNRSFFACHTVMKVFSTPLFVAECQSLVNRGFSGVGERKKYPPFFEFLLMKCTGKAIFAYDPQRIINKLTARRLQ